METFVYLSMRKFSKPIKVRLLDEATEYIGKLDKKIRSKFFKSFEKVESGHKGEWFKPLEDGIWEFRERDHRNFYRIFAFWDSSEDQETLIIGTHGLNKKSNKTPRKDIEKVKRIRKKYFEFKNRLK